VNSSRVRAVHEATLPHPAASVWRYFHWPNLALMQPAGFFADIAYDDQRPVPGAVAPLRSVAAMATERRCARFWRRAIGGDASVLSHRRSGPVPVEDYRGEVKVRPIAARVAGEVLLRVHAEGIDAATWRATYAGMQQATSSSSRKHSSPLDRQSCAASRATTPSSH
jgi:hypothetical protein